MGKMKENEELQEELANQKNQDAKTGHEIQEYQNEQKSYKGQDGIITNKNCKICIMSSYSNAGRKLLSMNISAELSNRDYDVIYGTSINEKTGLQLNKKTARYMDEEQQISVYESKLSHLNVLSFSKESAQVSPKKMEDLIVNLPEKMRESSDFLVFNVKDPLEFPDRYMLLCADIFVMIVKADASVFSNIFQQLEKLSFIPKPPGKIYLIFNKTRDIEIAFDSYKMIVDEALDLNINIDFVFLGIVPYDPIRQRIAGDAQVPLVTLFPDSVFRSCLSLITSKIIKSNE